VGALLLGQLPRSHPLVPEFGFDIRDALAAVRSGDSEPQRHPLRLPARVTAPSHLHIAGRLPAAGGRIVIYGHWNAEGWFRISTAPVSPSGEYSATIRIRRTGMLNLRVRTPSGELLVGSTRVRE
jgi:hypothetical protein